jgi:threonine/homoserine/homoserine lactone efflux protein
MMAPLALEGLLVGFSIAAPVGPIGVLCIRRTLAEGRASGLATGLGAATADALYGCVAGFGLTWISALLVGQQEWIRIVGGAFLLALGWRTFTAAPAERAAAGASRSLAADYGSTFALTLTNPATILSFVAVFAGLGLGSSVHGPAAATTLVIGVFAGSAAWWLLLSGGVSVFRARFDTRALRWVNRLSGAVIAAFGAVAIGSLAFGGAA